MVPIVSALERFHCIGKFINQYLSSRGERSHSHRLLHVYVATAAKVHSEYSQNAESKDFCVLSLSLQIVTQESKK